MMMLREIITPQTQNYTVRIPLEYLNTKVEILVLPFSDKINHEDDKSVDFIKKTAGILSPQKIDPIEWQKQIRDEWNDRE
jgi:hypothetical protein